ncbi:MAG: GDSL-type esterase/lipase family protein [Desulfuromonadales bacterium]
MIRSLVGILMTVLLAACGGSSDDDEKPPPVEGPLTYLALGASDAFGIGASPLENGYVYRIEDALDDERADPTDLINSGIPGAQADDIGHALDLALLAGVRPDLVTLWAGANDLTQGRSVADFEADLAAILSRLRQDADALIFVGNLPDLSALPRYIAEPDSDVTVARVAEFNAAIDRQAQRHGVALVRLAALPIEPELTSDIDGFHPSNEGHARIAEAFLQVIRPVLGLAQP